MEHAHAAIVRRRIEECFDQKNMAVVDEIVAPDFIGHAPGGRIAARGAQQVKGMLQWHARTFHDVQSTIEDLLVVGDKVVVRTSTWGSYQGGWRNIPGASQRVFETGITICHIVDAKIREAWFEVSDLQVLEQLGALAPVTSG